MDRKDHTVGGLLHERAAATPDQRFVWCGGTWLTYAEVVEVTDRLAGGLQRLGVQAGDRVAVVLPNEMPAVLLIFACARLGAIQVPLNTYLRGEFLRYQLADCQASVIVTDAIGYEQVVAMATELPDLREVVVTEPVEHVDARGFHVPTTAYDELLIEGAPGTFSEVDPCSTFSIIYTSGTTGLPKGCLMAHRYATHMGRALMESGRFRPGDVVLTASPLFHTSGQIFAGCSALYAGGSIAYERQFSASTLIQRAIEVEATVVFGVGAMGLMLLAQPPRDTDRSHQLRAVVMNGMPEAAQLALEERFGFHVVGEMYGQTEFVPACASPVDGPRNRASAGRPLEHVEIDLFDDDDHPVPLGSVGEIVLRPRRPGVMFDGYWNKPEATLELRRNLWHHTGDFGRFDEAGFLHFVDRKKDAIRRRGEFVVARELEAAILTHPDVAAVAVHAVSSELTEEEIRAWIVPESGASLTADVLFDFFRDQLPYFAIPRYVDLTDQLPVNQTQRVMKFELRERPMTASTWDFEALGLVVSRDERRGVARRT